MPSTSTPTTNQAAADGTAAYNLQRDRPLNPTDMPFIDIPGIKVRHTNGLAPFGFLKLFLTTTIMQTIIDETNRFGLERHGDDREKLSDKDMWRVFALIILMALNKKSKITSYWSTNPNYHQPIFGNTLSRNRFLRILSCFHLVDNSTRTPTSPRLFKLGTVYQAIVDRFKAVYTPLRNISIDETLSHWRGRVSFRQYIPSKRTRNGITAHVRTKSETGYVYDHHIYTGEEQQNAILVGLNIVLSLMQSILDVGNKLWMDNYYNSPSLTQWLLDFKTHVCGTLRSNRKGVPKMVQKTTANKKLKKGQFVFYSNDKFMVGTWQDKKPITMISTMHADTVPANTGKTTHDGQPIAKPQCIQDYNR